MRRILVTRTARCAVGALALAATVALPTRPAAAAPAPDGDAAAVQQIRPRLAAVPARPAARPLYSPAAETRINTQIGLMPTARELTRQAAAGSDIGGVRLDLAAGVLHLYRLEAEREPRLPAGLAGAAKVLVHPARFNRTTMTRAVDTVTRDSDLLVTRKVTVDSVAPKVDGSGITVVVVVAVATAAAEIEAAAKELRSRYGDIVAEVVGTQRVPSDDERYFAGRRFNDSSPWSGGDRIVSAYGGCTTGFAAVQGTQPVMLTAAHCGPVGTAFYNGPNNAGGYTYMGTANQSNSDTDVGAIAVDDSWPFVNVGPAENSYQFLVTDWGAPVVGSTVCTSGSYTGEVCQLEVVTSGVRSCLRRNIFGSCRRWTGHFADAINRAGPWAPAAGHGDSGGPVYEFSVPSAGVGNAVGLISAPMTGVGAARFPDYYPDTLLCDSPEGPSHRCSSGFSFAHMPGY